MPRPTERAVSRSAGSTSSHGVAERVRQALIEGGFLQADQLEEALKIQRTEGGALSRILIQKGWVEPETLTAVLSRTLRIPVIRLSKMAVDPDLARMVPVKQAVAHQVVPVSRIGERLSIAMSDPMNVLALDQIAQATGLVLTPFLATEEEVQQALHRLYGVSLSRSLEELDQAAGDGSVELLTRGGGEPEVSTGELLQKTQEGPVVRVTHAILSEGVLQRASDILIEPFEKKLRIRYRVDGAFREGPVPPPAMREGIVSRLKVMANLNIAEHRLPQDGRIGFSVRGKPIDFRVSVIPSYYGEKICLRVLDKTQVRLEINRLGFEPAALDQLRRAAARPNGMLLITGPTGSGKTTTLYALLKAVDTPEKNLVTVEDPVEYDIDGVNQVSIRPDVGLTFAAGLRSILRQDPDVILVGEIRDGETADVAVKAALTGHLVLSTLHANDALSTVARLTNMGIEPYLIAASIRLLGAQRLLRKVCGACARPHHPSKELVRQLKLPDGNYRKGVGCPACRGSGLAGRAGILEAIPLTGDLRALVETGASTGQLREAAQANGTRFLWDHALELAAQGVLPLEEAMRSTLARQT